MQAGLQENPAQCGELFLDRHEQVRDSLCLTQRLDRVLAIDGADGQFTDARVNACIHDLFIRFSHLTILSHGLRSAGNPSQLCHVSY